MTRRGGPDRGSASVWVLAAGLVLVAIAGTGVLSGAAMVARHRAQTAADLGALAGARFVVVESASACALAESIVEANGAAMDTCRIDGMDLIVAAAVPVAGAPPGIGPATATARAGPVQEIRDAVTQ